MAEKKFKFVSPGILLEEIDNSGLPGAPTPPGPVIIGRTERGPAMRPITVRSFSEFIQVFGNPIAGGQGGDVWREGNYTSPTYAAYAAQAWLKNNSPCTIMRTLGAENAERTTAGRAGWGASADAPNGVDFGTVSPTTGGGAYGLFLFNSSSALETQSGSLAAVFYTTASSGASTAVITLALSGNQGGIGSGHPTASQAQMIATQSGGGFIMSIGTQAAIAAGTAENVRFNLNRNSARYIRKVFNTNPTLVNDQVVGSAKSYFLGETFDCMLQTGSAGNKPNQSNVGLYDDTYLSGQGQITHGVLLGLASQDDNLEWANHQSSFGDGRTGWFIGQDLGDRTTFNAEKMQQLFKLHGLNHGEWLQNHLKISIEDVRPSSTNTTDYGTFSVVLRSLKDSDKAPVVFERFTGLTLNPNSENYIARVIGDYSYTWDDVDKRYRIEGDYPNVSKFIRVEMNTDVADAATDARLLPFGVFGPPRYQTTSLITGGVGPAQGYYALKGETAGTGDSSQLILPAVITGTLGPQPFVGCDFSPYAALAPATQQATSSLSASYIFPTIGLRESGSDGDTSPRQAYFGAKVGRPTSYNTYDASVSDVIKRISSNLSVGNATYQSSSWVFTLDDLSASTSPDGTVKDAVYVSGSRADSTLAQRSISAINDYALLLTGSNYRFNRFTTVFHGGFDGFDITELDPLRNTLTNVDGANERTSSPFNTIKRCVDTIRDPESVEMNLALMPGINTPGLTAGLIEACEDRGDALAIIDLENDYVPTTAGTTSAAARRPNVENAVNSLKERNLNSSYGCAYFPWVQIRDNINNALVNVPPSVVALGTISSSEKKRAAWFAPAGFTRGGLTQGAAGLPVVATKSRLSSRDRDNLYEANVNPIATFPAEGIVIFGQKTLQMTTSALDRINVRRLLLLVKREISRISATMLFEQNVQATWSKFKGKAESLLSGIQAGQGLTDYKVILDDTTTTPEMIDRNIMYAKVFLKPAQAIEFVAVDFVITDSGASFDD